MTFFEPDAYDRQKNRDLAPATLERMQNDARDRPLVPQYDFVFTSGGGDPVIENYRRFGARACIPIDNALDPTTHHPVAPKPEFDADLSFLGNRLPDREARVEEFFLRAAALLPHRRFLLGGSGWGDKDLPPSVHYRGHVFTGDHNAFNCTPRAVLNVSRASMAANGWSPATRAFEAAGAAACLITDAWEGIDFFLEPDREVLVARDGAEVAAIVEGLDEERAKRIGEAARRRVLAEHTYEHRAKQVVEILGGREERRSATMLRAARARGRSGDRSARTFRRASPSGDWVAETAEGVTAFYDIDTPVTLAKLAKGDFDYLAPPLIPRFDLYLSFTGGPTLRQIEQQYGAPRARALYCSFDPDQYHPQETRTRWDLGSERRPLHRGRPADRARELEGYVAEVRAHERQSASYGLRRQSRRFGWKSGGEGHRSP